MRETETDRQTYTLMAQKAERERARSDWLKEKLAVLVHGMEQVDESGSKPQ